MYQIQACIYKYGEIYLYTDKAKPDILALIKRLKKAPENTYICIDATNLETGETQRVWDNTKNPTLFGNS